MPNALTINGLTTATYAELVSFYIAAYQKIYGTSINLDSDSPDGQMMNITIQVILDLQDLLMQIYNGFDPDNAIGVVLDQRVAINGIQRLEGTFTVTNVTLTVVTGSTINLYGLDQSAKPVYTVQDTAGNQWQLQITQQGVTTGSHVYSFQAANPGAITPTIGTISVPVTIVLGVTGVNNPTTYTTLGITEESDAALKIRRQQSVSLASQGYLSGLYAALENINGVTSVAVVENDTAGNVTYGGDIVPSHSIWVIIGGTPVAPTEPAWNSLTTYSIGDLVSSGATVYVSIQNNNTNNIVSNASFWNTYNPIGQAIYVKRNAGCGMYGSTSYNITQGDGSQFTVKWDTVVTEPFFIAAYLYSINGTTIPNISGIISQLPTSFKPAVNAEININALSTTIQNIDSNSLVTFSGASTPSVGGFCTTLGGTYTNTLTPTSPKYQFTLSGSNIILLPVIMNAPNATPTFTGGLVTMMKVSVLHGGNTITFSPLGGHGVLTYSLISGGGSINSSTGVYTSGIAGTDVVQVTDGLGNTAQATITVT